MLLFQPVNKRQNVLEIKSILKLKEDEQQDKFLKKKIIGSVAVLWEKKSTDLTFYTVQE